MRRAPPHPRVSPGVIHGHWAVGGAGTRAQLEEAGHCGDLEGSVLTLVLLSPRPPPSHHKVSGSGPHVPPAMLLGQKQQNQGTRD